MTIVPNRFLVNHGMHQGPLMSIELVIVDDHEVVRSGLAAMLGDRVKVVASVGSIDAALAAIKKQLPQVILLDVRLGELDGLEGLGEVRSQFPSLPVVVLSAYDNPTYIARAVALGASDYVLKSSPREILLAAIERAAKHEAAPPSSLLQSIHHVMQQSADVDVPGDLPLTGREVQVLRHLALGLSNREVGQSLEISVETVKEHVQNILRKLNVADRTEAAVRAIKAGLVR
jgi:DNA-binding NarL/FixJ family response regulator